MNKVLEPPIVPDSNKHVKEYLSYYVSFPHSPHFAVLLNGTWGIGKTFLVEKYLKTLEKHGKKFVYISLYGLASIDEINDALFRSLYPKLSGTTAKIAGRIANVAMKYYRVDGVIDVKDFMEKFSCELYVFDDLERCEVPINKVLGYINEFVEHDRCKVIIIANEKEIVEDSDYRRRREKLIGKTLEVQSAFGEALDYFISKIDNPDAKTFFTANTDEISSIYHHSKLFNLRILQQTMWDFERFYASLDTKHRENKNATVALLRLLFGLSFEVKAGRLGAEELIKRRSCLIGAIIRRDKKGEPSRLEVAAARYPGVDFGDTVLSDEVLIDILFKGIINEEEIRKLLDTSSYFVSAANEPSWRTVWYALERTDAEFEAALQTLEKQFRSRAFIIAGEALHVFGIRLWLANIGVLKKSRSDVVSECKKYIDDLYAQGKLEPMVRGEVDEFRSSGYDGLGIHEHDTDDYQDVCRHLKAKRVQADQDRYPVQAADLMKEMEADPELFFRRLNLTNSPDNIFYDIPILVAINPDEFVSTVLRQHPVAQRTILMSFKGRYEFDALNRKLADERPWLKAVRSKILSAAESMPPMAKYRISQYVLWNLDPWVRDPLDVVEPL